MAALKIKINGKDIELENSSTIAEMILEKQVTGSMFVIEKNQKIVAKEDYSTTPIQDNDVIEIVGFFGGG